GDRVRRDLCPRPRRRAILPAGTEPQHGGPPGAVREAARPGADAVPEGAGGDTGTSADARLQAAHLVADARVRRLLAILAACGAAWGCAGRAPLPAAPPPFRFANDTFAFSNETVLVYDIDEATGHATWRKREPPPAFSLRCGSMVRAARQFHLNARFVPDQRP